MGVGLRSVSLVHLRLDPGALLALPQVFPTNLTTLAIEICEVLEGSYAQIVRCFPGLSLLKLPHSNKHCVGEMREAVSSSGRSVGALTVQCVEGCAGCGAVTV